MANHLDSDQAFSGVAQTANLGSSTSVSSGAAKIFREFKWGLLTLFILMAVVVGLVYDGGRKKKTETAGNTPNQRMEGGLTLGESSNNAGNGAADTTTNPATPGNGTSLGGGNSNVVGGSDQLGTIPNRGSRAQLLEQDGPDAWNPTPIPNQPITHGRGANGAQAQPNRGGRQQNNDAMVEETPTRGQGNDSERETPERPQRNGGNRNPQNGPDARLAQGQQNNAPAGGKMYVVKAGDSLWKIATANGLGKNGVKVLVDANKDTLPNPDRLREGMKLHIPTPGGSTATASSETTKPEKNVRGTSGSETHGSGTQATQDTYVVQQGDSLERIARRVLNDGRKWKDLLEWNKDKLSDPSKLKVGMTIRTHGTASTAPAATETPVRYQSNPVRAQYDMHEEPVFPPENDIAPIPVSPVSASKKINYPVEANKKAKLMGPEDALFSPAN